MRKFLVATMYDQDTGPEVSYGKYQIVEAKNPPDACEKYNKINNCSHFYGVAIGDYDEESKTVTIPIGHFIKES